MGEPATGISRAGASVLDGENRACKGPVAEVEPVCSRKAGRSVRLVLSEPGKMGGDETKEGCRAKQSRA